MDSSFRIRASLMKGEASKSLMCSCHKYQKLELQVAYGFTSLH